MGDKGPAPGPFCVINLIKGGSYEQAAKRIANIRLGHVKQNLVGRNAYLKDFAFNSATNHYLDILMLSHPGHYLPDYAALIPQNDGTGKILRVPGAWEKLLDSRIEEVEKLIEWDKKQIKMQD